MALVKYMFFLECSYWLIGMHFFMHNPGGLDYIFPLILLVGFLLV